jgi:DNA-binding NarL/FixJ family response regulator
MITLGIVDDHQLFAKSLANMLNNIEPFKVIIEALNGKNLQEKLADLNTLPDIILLDMNMPVMNGIETALWLQKEKNQLLK